MKGGRKCNRKPVISWNRWDIQPKLLLITNMKYHTPCQMRWKSLTLIG